MNYKVILSAALLTIASIKAECETPCCPNDMKSMNPKMYTIAFSVEMMPDCCQETRDMVKGIMNNCIEECSTCATMPEKIEACSKAAKACCMVGSEVVVQGTITAQEAQPAQEEVAAQETETSEDSQAEAGE